MAERRAWSLISLERLAEYTAQSERLIDFAARENIAPFAAALAGVGFIHTAIAVMGGAVDWWIELVRDPAAIARYIVAARGGAPAPGPTGKQ